MSVERKKRHILAYLCNGIWFLLLICFIAVFSNGIWKCNVMRNEVREMSDRAIERAELLVLSAHTGEFSCRLALGDEDKVLLLERLTSGRVSFPNHETISARYNVVLVLKNGDLRTLHFEMYERRPRDGELVAIGHHSESVEPDLRSPFSVTYSGVSELLLNFAAQSGC